MTNEQIHPEGIVFSRNGVLEKCVDTIGFPPDPRLALYIHSYWAMTWDLPSGASYPSLVLPSGCVNILFSPANSMITGVRQEALSYTLNGRGLMIGVLFSPGGFFPFYKRAVSTITDSRVLLRDFLGAPAQKLESELFAAAENDSRADVLNQFFVSRFPSKPPTDVVTVLEITRYIVDNEEVLSTSQVVDHFAIDERKLQRLFSRHVGISAKVLIRTKRFQAAIKQMMTGAPINWADLSLRLGYYDQSHFINDFRKITGQSPAGLDLAAI